jgi:drug/metabolite transporter (DMT)-like permease
MWQSMPWRSVALTFVRSGPRVERGLLAALAAVLIWGCVPVATRYFVLQLDPLTFNIVRFAFSGAAALPIFVASRPWSWSASDQRRALLCALLAVPGYNMPVAFAAREISAGRIGLLIATEPLFIILFSALLQRRGIAMRLIGGALVAFAGVWLSSVSSTADGSTSWHGMLLVIGGAISWSAYTVLSGPLAKNRGSVAATSVVLVVGSAALLAASFALLPVAPHPGVGIVIELGLIGIASSLLGFLLWTYGTATTSAERIGLMLYLIPVVSLIGGAILLKERLGWSLIAGGVITLLGVSFAESRRSAPARE